MSMRTAFAGLLIAALAATVGWTLLARVEALDDRGVQVLAVYQDGALLFTTDGGESASVPQSDPCKFYEKPPSRACVAYYANGDEVFLFYDSADPSRTWFGATAPGGYGPALLFWSGVAGGVFSLLWLWFASPWYRRLRRPVIPGAPPPPLNED